MDTLRKTKSLITFRLSISRDSTLNSVPNGSSHVCIFLALLKDIRAHNIVKIGWNAAMSKCVQVRDRDSQFIQVKTGIWIDLQAA